MKNKELKILAIIPSGFCFGLQHITIDFFSGFPPNIKSHFLVTRWHNGEFTSLLKKHNLSYSYSWLGMFSRKLDWKNLKMSLHALIKLPILYFDFIKIKRKSKPDVLYFANHHELILLFPILIFTRKKIVCHMHDPSPANDFQKFTFKFYSKVVHHFIAISDDVKNRTILLGCPLNKITTIHNGIEINNDLPCTRMHHFADLAGWKRDTCIIGMTGQMTATKGLNDLIDAFKIVKSQNENVRLVIGGKKNEIYYQEILQQIKKNDLENYVYFTGWLSNSSIFYKNIDIYVLASRHDEGFGLVVAEAMMHNLPVVATKSGGVIEIIEDGKSGLLVPKNNPERLSKAICNLLNDYELRNKISYNSKVRILKNFDIQIQREKFLLLLTQ